MKQYIITINTMFDDVLLSIYCFCFVFAFCLVSHGGLLPDIILLISTTINTGRPGSSEVSMYPLTRWDVSSIPANGIFLTKKVKNKNKNAQRAEND